MLAANPVDTAVALNEAHGLPRQIIVDGVPALLKVYTLGQDVRRKQENVEVVCAAPSRWFGRLGHKPIYSCIARYSTPHVTARNLALVVTGRT